MKTSKHPILLFLLLTALLPFALWISSPNLEVSQPKGQKLTISGPDSDSDFSQRKNTRRHYLRTKSERTTLSPSEQKGHLPKDLAHQLVSSPPGLPADLRNQLESPPPELPDDIKNASEQGARVVTAEEVNNPLQK